MGVTRVHFHSVGKRPLAMDRLNSLVRLGAINAAVDRNITAETLSSPVDFAGSRLSKRSVTSSVQSRCGGHLLVSRRVGSVSGLKESLKQLWENLLCSCALPEFEVIKVDPSFRAGIEHSCLLTSF